MYLYYGILYIYLHIKIINGEPFYVGKGKDKRCLVKKNRSLHWNNIVKKYDYDIILLEEKLSEKEAIEKEKYWIKRIGRKDSNNGLLVHFTDGGKGSSGRPMNQNTKNKLSDVNKGRPTSDKQKEIVGSRYKNKFGKDHNRSVNIVINGVEFPGYSEASRKLKTLISTLHYRVKSKSKKWEHFQIKN